MLFGSEISEMVLFVGDNAMLFSGNCSGSATLRTLTCTQHGLRSACCVCLRACICYVKFRQVIMSEPALLRTRGHRFCDSDCGDISGPEFLLRYEAAVGHRRAGSIFSGRQQ